jgi:hypothetical protein
MKNILKIIAICNFLIIIELDNSVFAQQTPIYINFEARLENVLVLNITPDTFLEFGIKRINDSLYQITKQPDDVFFSVESTGSWNLSISTSEPFFRGINDTTQKIPVDFVGLYIENRGTNWDNGLFSNIANVTKDTVIFLRSEKTKLLESGERDNIGGNNRNSFILRWKFFYEDDALKTRKFSDFDIEDDEYVVKFYLTLSESDLHHRKQE